MEHDVIQKAMKVQPCWERGLGDEFRIMREEAKYTNNPNSHPWA